MRHGDLGRRRRACDSQGANRVGAGGQKGVSHILEGISEGCPCLVVREQKVTQGNCRMLQVADFICTVKLIGLRLDAGLALNLSEQKFFGSPRTFERNILRKIKAKEI